MKMGIRCAGNGRSHLEKGTLGSSRAATPKEWRPEVSTSFAKVLNTRKSVRRKV